jgi:hypothetical protein
VLCGCLGARKKRHRGGAPLPNPRSFGRRGSEFKNRLVESESCARGRTGYAISDRLGFLVSSIAILEQLKAVGIESIELPHLLAMSAQANKDLFRVWDVGSTYP